MKTNQLNFAAALVAAIFATGVLAQPAPNGPASVSAAASAPAPDRVIYLSQLPSTTEVVNEGKARGLSVSRIEQTNDSVTVVYVDANGRTTTVLYRPISAVDSASSVMPQPAAPAAVAVPTTAPTVEYAAPAYDTYPYAYGPYGSGWGWPLGSIGLGFGWGRGYYGRSYYGGGYRGGGYYHGGGHIASGGGGHGGGHR